jgi:hypothetical protein
MASRDPNEKGIFVLAIVRPLRYEATWPRIRIKLRKHMIIVDGCQGWGNTYKISERNFCPQCGATALNVNGLSARGTEHQQTLFKSMLDHRADSNWGETW